MQIINSHLNQLECLCTKHNVENLFVFGSVANNKSNINSDIDFLVEFGQVQPMKYFDNYLNLKNKLEKLFSKNVDLVEIQTVTNPILKNSIERDKIRIYGREDSEVAI